MFVVTGGAGFIGSACIWKLNQMGVDDIMVVDNLGRSDKWKNLVNLRYRDYVHKSVFLDELIGGKFDRFEAIIHMGACSSTTERNADYLMANNYRYSRKLAQYAIDHNIRLINASSAATYGDGGMGFLDDISLLENLKPLNMYGYSKHLFDMWALRTKVLDKLVSLKFFNVFGPNEYHKGDMRSMVFKAFFQVRETGRIRLFKSYRPKYADGGQRRDFVYIKDCVNVIQWLLENPAVNGVFNLGTGQARTWNALGEAVFNAMNVSKKIDYIEMPDPLRDSYQYFTQADLQKLKKTSCPVRFRSLDEAVKDYVSGYLQQADMYLASRSGIREED